MRQRIISALSWIAVTILATGIGFVAISTVGEVLRGSGPAGRGLQHCPAPPRGVA